MTPAWGLPVTAQLGGRTYTIHADYRDILDIFSWFSDPDLPEYLRWRIALALFYEEEIPTEQTQAAMEFLTQFLRCGDPEEPKPGPKLLDWEQDAPVIIAEVNKVAGQEIRALPFVHWWTFMAWFHAIGEGQLSTLVSIRDKLSRGKKLEKWEEEFYRQNKSRVTLRKRYTAEELAQQARLKQLLGE